MLGANTNPCPHLPLSCHICNAKLSPMSEDTKTPARSKLVSGSAARTAIYLILASMLVGFVLATLGLNPIDFWQGLVRGIGNLVEGLINLGWGAIYSVVQYIVLGAVIVIPIWLFIKLTNRVK